MSVILAERGRRLAVFAAETADAVVHPADTRVGGGSKAVKTRPPGLPAYNDLMQHLKLSFEPARAIGAVHARA